MENEVWKDIPEYEGLYQVSNLGNVKSLNYNHKKKYGIMKSSDTLSGYKRIQLCKEGKVNSVYPHRLVAYSFIENPDNKPEVNHKNGVKNDNRVENLEWFTKSENQIHSIHILGNMNHIMRKNKKNNILYNN